MNLSTSVSARTSPGFRPTPPGSPPVPTSYSLPGGFYQNQGSTSRDSFSSQSTTSPTSPNSFAASQSFSSGAARLSREKNRLTLRAYLHSLLAASELSSSPVLRSFLLSGPTKLSPEEVEDAKRREEADQLREDGRKRFAREIAARVDGLRDAAKSVKGELFAKGSFICVICVHSIDLLTGGLTHIFATIKVTEDIRQLPGNFQAVIEWARISCVCQAAFLHPTDHERW